MNDMEYGLAIENAKLRERCTHLEKTIETQTAEISRLNNKIDYLIEKVADLSRNPFANISPTPLSTKKGCSVCGMGSNGEVLGYVCTRVDCPSAIRC
jgi:uncharacterized coiled-coil protein SlyX